jgi:hypothetical protein
MKHITTTYHGPTSAKGTRIIARLDNTRKMLIYARNTSSERVEESHRKAAYNLAKQLWNLEFAVTGKYPNVSFDEWIGYPLDPDTYIWFVKFDPDVQEFDVTNFTFTGADPTTPRYEIKVKREKL